MDRRHILFAGIAFVCALSRTSATAGSPPHLEILRLSVRTAECEHVLLAERFSGTRNEDGGKVSTTFKILDVSKSAGKRFRKGDNVTVDRRLPDAAEGKQPSTWLLMALGPVVQWYPPTPATAALWDYAKEIPPPADDPKEALGRADYFIPWIDHDEVTIQSDAVREISTLSHEAWAKVARRIPRQQLRKWLRNTLTPSNRHGLAAVLLAKNGTEDDATLLESVLRDVAASEQPPTGISDLMIGVMLIRGEQGLDMLDRHFLKPGPPGESKDRQMEIFFSGPYYMLQALRFIRIREPDLIPQERRRESMRLLLDRRILTDMVIDELTEAKDWSIRDRLMKMCNGDPQIDSADRRAIIRYIYVCNQHAAPDSADAKSTAQNLRTLREKDRRLYDSTVQVLRIRQKSRKESNRP